MDEIEISSESREIEMEQYYKVLTEWLNDLQLGDKYHAKGTDVGWKNKSGETTVTLSDGEELLRKVAPDGPWEITATKEEGFIRLTVSHHDSPTGETHEIYPQ